jgi:hydrogenase maturation protease
MMVSDARSSAEVAFAQTPALALVALGNSLMRDDGLGPHLLRLIEAQYELPGDQVLALEVGTAGPDLFVSYVPAVESVVLLDAIEGGGWPGEVEVWNKTALLERAMRRRMLSAHEAGLCDGLAAAELAHCAPKDIWLIGAIVDCVDCGIGLSEEVRGALPVLIYEVIRVLTELGVTCRARRELAPESLWWLPTQLDPKAAAKRLQ